MRLALALAAPAAQSDSSAAGAGALFGAAFFGFVLLITAALWRLFAKAGRPGWACLIPIYNVVVLLQIIGRPWWYAGFMVTPPTAAVVTVILVFGTSRSFGKGWPFALGMLLLPFVFLPILAFGGASYVGPMGPSYRRGPALPRRVG